MLEKPQIRDEYLLTCVREHYGMAAVNLDFLPIGYDSNASAYRLETGDGKAYFLKVKSGHVHKAALIIARYLNDVGIDQVVAPIPARNRRLWQRVKGFALMLYPFIEGRTGMEAGLSFEQWDSFGAILHRIHATTLPHHLSQFVRIETFAPKHSNTVRKLQAYVDSGHYRNSYEQELAEFWKERSEEIRALVGRAEALGRLLSTTPPNYRLCHADIHTANILCGPQGELSIIDWDEALLAPKERDLMFIVNGTIGGSVVRAAEEARFFRGYGPADINWLALAYYRYEWVVQEIGEFGELVFLRQDVGATTRNAAAQEFRDLFHPGNVVEAAYASEKAHE